MHSFYGTPIPPEKMQDLFCAHCGADRGSINDMLAHLRVTHKEERPVSGVDFLSGASVIRQQREQAAEVERFGRNIDSIRGADDFLLECGDA